MRPRVVAEIRLLFRHQRVSQLLDILRDEIMLIQQNERLKQLNQLFHSFQTSLRPRQRRLPQRQRRHDPLDRL